MTEFNHWLRGFCYTPPTLKTGEELERHYMSWALRTINSFEDLGFRVDRRSITLDPSSFGCGVMVGFRFRAVGSLMQVYGV